MLSSSQIRQQFLDFFQSKGHQIVPSAPIVIKGDPTLMFTNAGMNQFKEYFLGHKKAPYSKVVDTQKCLRVSGKHNDLEEVGVDTYHHTMFEMLGNWSFGDYFKHEAIAWSWELLTEVYKIDKDRLYVTVFEGDAKENLPPSFIALEEWKKLVSDDHIVYGNKKDNFWEMGDTGPCGPCSEIHVDLRTDEERRKIPGHHLVNKDHPQVIEIWNNVFIQYNRKKDGTLEDLPAKHVDTGMGFERLVRVLQHKQSNYDTDIFTGTIAEVEKITNQKYSPSPLERAGERTSIAFRVIADHIRAIAFTIADGQLPSNTGAGYVIRRILRRAVRYYFSYLEYKKPLLHQLIPLLVEQFKNVFPELEQQKDFVSKVIKEEEEAFLRTINSGISLFNSFIENGEKIHGKISEKSQLIHIKANNGKIYDGLRRGKKIFGEFAFELNDTYGFPIDLTQLMAKEVAWEVDMNGYYKCLEKQKQRSRAATSIETEDWIVLKSNARNAFVGYNQSTIKTQVTQYRKVITKGKEQYQLVLQQTPFYAESGGQIGDTGILHFNNEPIEVINTKKENGLIVHYIEALPAQIEVEVIAEIDITKRLNTTLHHSATHLLHAALRKVLGTHVTQKGSLVNEEHLRFDFSHFAKITDEELQKIETVVNEKIRENVSVIIKELPKEEALKLGAMALFGEKYGDVVRVVIMDENYSVELCGGTHIAYTGQLGYFKIISETGVAAGVRRIEAVSGIAAENYINTKLLQLDDVSVTLKNPKDVVKAIEQIQGEQAQQKKYIEKIEKRLRNIIIPTLISKKETINNISFIGSIVDVPNAEMLKRLCLDIKNELADYIIVLAANIDGKAAVAISIAETIVNTKGFDANKIIKETISPLINGSGGGQKTLASAVGQDISKLKDVVGHVRKIVSQ